jgi:hypothetical protein
MTATPEIRFVLRFEQPGGPTRKVLQQKFTGWRADHTQHSEWRDVPLVDEETGRVVK